MNFLTQLLANRQKGTGPKVSKLIADKNLSIVFQPMVTLQDGTICGYEALVRLASHHNVADADTLFDAAKAQHHQKQLELACMEEAIEQWSRKTNGSQLSLNITAASLVMMEQGLNDGALIQLIDNCRLPSRVLAIEVTHLSSKIDPIQLQAPVAKLRKHNVQITFDDFKCTESHMKIWPKLAPSMVKMDMSLTTGIAKDPAKQKRVQALVALSRRYGNRLAAKGIETAEDIIALNEAGVDCGQGYFLGSPDADPADHLNMRARVALQSGWGHIDVAA